MMSKGKVMVVDDDVDFLGELRQTLDQSGYEVIQVHDPTQVHEMASNTEPDVILLDLKMRSMNGFEVAEELRHFSLTDQIPIIAMTGYFTEEEHRSLMNICGIKRCLNKPFNPLDVIEAIEMALKKSD